MIDTHSHLFDDAFNLDLEDCLKRCKNENINKIILVGFSHETNILANNLAKKNNIFYPTAGLHPSEANSNYRDDLIKLENFIKNNKVYAIGECGLDYHYGKENIEEQKALFKGQIELSKKYNLPLIIHMRDATLDTYQILKEYDNIYGVMHCYSGSLEMANEFIKLGFYISLGGPVTYKNAKDVKKVAECIDINKLLIETDCPYLPPVPFRGQRNESSYVKYVLKEISSIRKIDALKLEKIIDVNANNLFKLEDRI